MDHIAEFFILKVKDRQPLAFPGTLISGGKLFALRGSAFILQSQITAWSDDGLI